MQESIAGLDAVHADQILAPGAHTIHQIVLHIAAWMDEAAERIEGRRHEEPRMGNFPATVDWRQSQRLLAETTERLIAAIREGDIASHFEPLAGVALHNSYHAGQIILLRKLIG